VLEELKATARALVILMRQTIKQQNLEPENKKVEYQS
jgi:hypothetical protein